MFRVDSSILKYSLFVPFEFKDNLAVSEKLEKLVTIITLDDCITTIITEYSWDPNTD